MASQPTTPSAALSKTLERAQYTATEALRLIESGELSPLAMRGEIRKLATWVQTIDDAWAVVNGADRIAHRTR